MSSRAIKQDLARIQARRQRRRWLRRSWNWVIGDTMRGVRSVSREIRAWLTEPRELLP